MVSLSSVKVLLMAALAVALPTTVNAAQTINAVWSTGSFETISGTAGNEIGHDQGFSLVDANGNTIYNAAYPGDYSACQMNGHTFTLSGGCFTVDRQFECTSKFSGDPKSCEVLDAGGTVIGSADGDSSTDFIGIAISVSGYCGIQFTLNDDESCAANTDGFTVG